MVNLPNLEVTSNELLVAINLLATQLTSLRDEFSAGLDTLKTKSRIGKLEQMLGKLEQRVCELEADRAYALGYGHPLTRRRTYDTSVRKKNNRREKQQERK